jgi:hypothetical protein
MSEGKWHYYVRGRLVGAGAGEPLPNREVIVESAVRAESAPLSPFCHKGVGPIARSNASGEFKTWFVTLGAAAHIERPPSIVVLIRVGLGEWQSVKIETQRGSVQAISDTELLIELGRVPFAASAPDAEKD